MPVYTTTLPNGQSIRVMGPSNATPETIQQAALQIAAQRRAAPYVDTGERNYSLGTAASKAFSRGTERLKSGFGDVIPAMVGKTLGFDEFAERQMQEAQASEELIQRKYAPQIKSYKDVDGVGSAIKFGAETVFEQIPNLATMLVPGAAAPQVARIGAGKLAATELVKRQAAAQGIGVYMGSYALNAPEVFKNIYEETGELATGTAVLFGAAAAALDSVLPSTILKNITPFEKSALAASVLRRSGTRPGITKSVLSGIAKGSGAEALTEGAQEAISISAENFVAGNSQYFDSEDWDRVMESAVRGAVAGGTFRGISEPFGRVPAEPKKTEPEVKEEPKQSDLQENALKTKAIADVTEEEAKKNMKKEPTPVETKNYLAENNVEGGKLNRLTRVVDTSDIAVDSTGNYYLWEKGPSGSNEWVKGINEGSASAPITEKQREQINSFVNGEVFRKGVIRGIAAKIAGEKPVVEEVQTKAAPELPYEGFRPPEGMTLEEGIAYYNGLDEIEQANYQPPTQEAPVNETQTDATEFGEETFGGSTEVLGGATDRVAEGTTELVGGEVGASDPVVSPVGGGEGVVNPALEETVEETWEAMSISEIPFAELSTENKQRLTEAKEDLGITGELVDQIDQELGFQESRAAPPKTYTFEGKPIPQKLIDQHKKMEESDVASEGAMSTRSGTIISKNYLKQAEEFLGEDVTTSRGREFSQLINRINRPGQSAQINSMNRSVFKQDPRDAANFEDTQESRAGIKDTGQTAATVLAELVKEFGNNVIDTIKRGKLVIVDDVSQLPANIKMSSTANGAYDSNTQTSYIVANRIEKGQGRRILLHEIGEHYGLERMVGKDYTALLNRLKTLRKQNADIDALFGEVQELYPEFEVDSKPFLQEVMAKLGERAPNNTLFRRMVGAVKNFLRRLGIYDVNRFSDVDIQDMILNSLRVSLAESTGKSLASSTSGTPALQMSKNVEAKAALDVKRIMKIVGSNMYAKGDSAAVTVKELLQNAADSLKSLLAKGTIEKGNIEITIGRPFIFKDYGNENRVVSVKDSGKGMTPKTLSTTFITLGGSDKDPDASGGFGVAKAQFLFGNEGINVVTMNDGVISELISTGEALNKSVEEGIPLPEGTIMAYSPEEYNKIIIKREEARTKEDYRLTNQELNDDSLQPYMRLFPEGRGTIVEVKIPETYESRDTQADEEIDIEPFLSGYPELSESPLFSTSPDGNTIKKSNIEVRFQGASASAELVPIGANFPSEDFATNIDVEFPWGTAKIIVSKEEVEYPSYYQKNIVVLSNGLFQFESELRVNPKDRFGDLIQRKFYIDIKSKIQPGEKGYPFANNRQSLIPEAERDLELMKSYLQKEFGQLDLTNQFNSIVNTKFQILKKQKDGSIIAEDIPSLAKTEEKNAQDVIETKQDLEVTKAGKLIDKKTKVPVLTAKDIAEVEVSAEGLQIEKGIIPADQVIIHDNLETSLRDIGEDQLAVNLGDNQEFVPITQLAREKFGSRFDKFMSEIGEAFLLLRNQVIMLGNLKEGQSGKLPRDYNKLADNVVGISFDVSFRGVNIGGVPFQGMFVNPGAVEFTNSPEEAGVGMVGTMLHEMAHFYERDHEAGFSAEFQRLMGQLEAASFGEQPLLSGKKSKLRSLTATKKAVIKSIKDNEDIFKFLNSINQPGEIYEYGKRRQQIRPIGERFETSDLEVRDERASQNMAKPREQGRTRPERVSRDIREGDTAERREQQRESVSPKSKTTQESRVNNKNIQFSKENPPGGVNPTQDNALFKYAGQVQQKMPTPTKEYIKGVWDKITELPTSIKDAWTGMLGLQAMIDLYDKYLPSIKKLMNTLERRAAEVETTRAEVDVLGNLGMDIIQGKERQLIEYDEKTGQVKIDDNGQVVLTDKTTSKKYTDGQLKNWEQTTYKLSERDIDPRDQANFTDPDVMKFFNLPPELQALSIAYTEKFEQYGNNLLDAYKTAAEKAVQKDESAQEVVERVVKEFTENRLKFYHPFRRRGDYVLSYVSDKDLAEHNQIMEEIDNSEESSDQKAFRKAKEFKRYQPLVQTSRYETKAAYVEAAVRQGSADGITVLKAEIDPENKSLRVSGEGAVGIMQEVTSILQKTDEEGKPIVDEAVIKEVAGLFLDALPSQSIKQQSRQRLGTGGYIEDVVGGFIDLGARMATQVANLKYIPEINDNIKDVNNENAEMQAELDPTNPEDVSLQTSLSSAVNRLEDSKSFFHNPVAGPISSRFAYLSYLTSIAGNVSSALVNATQLAIIVYPTLVAEYGFGTANRVMGQAFSYYFGGGKDSNRGFLPDQSFGMKDGKLRTDLPEDLQQLYKTGIDNSVFRRGVGYELTEMRKTNAKDFVGTKAKFDALMGWMFQNTERMNREVTYIAGYLAAKEKGDSFEVAEEKSREFTRRSHGTALPEIGPKFFQQGFGKVMFTFKRYGHAMLHLLFKSFNDAYRGESKEVRNIARKQILGIYGASFTFAGLQGVPLYGFTQALAEMMYAMFGDEDEPFDFEESTREIFGDIGYRGPLNKLLNVDIASRTGFANLIWREDPRRVSEVGLMQYVLEQGLGPSFSYGLSVNRGLQDMARGNIYRGIEQTLPAFARNPLKAIRYATEGAVNRKGAEISPLNPLDGFLQIFGFTNEDLSLQYARNQSMKQAEKNFNARRSGLLTAAYLARKNGDFDMMREVQSKINDFNRSTIGSANPITGSTLKRSYKNREDSINNSVGGITLNKRIETAVREDMGS